MATIKIKRRNNSDDNAPASLEVGEPAYNEYQQVLYIGKDNGGAGQHQIGGKGVMVTWPGPGIIVQTAARSGATPPTSAARTITGTASEITVTNGDGVSGNPTISIPSAAITLAKMANLAQDQFIGRVTASTGVPETATITAAARTVLDDTSVALMVDTLGGASSTGTGGLVRATSPTLVTPALGTPSALVLTNATGLPTAGIVDAAVTLAKLANLAQDQFIGRVTASTGVPETTTITAAARTVLDDTTVGNMVNTLGGASSTGTTGLVRADSPTLTGTPLAPTAAAATSTTQIATTAFVKSQKVTDLTAPTASFSMNSQKITSLATPTADTDAATKGYVDSQSQGLDVKASVRVNSDVTSTLGVTYAYSATGGTSGRGQITWATGPTTVDGVTLANNDRILNSQAGAAGGIYVRTSANVWDRATDFDEDDEVSSGAFTFVEEGTSYADSGWTLTTNGTIVIGGGSGTSLAWSQFSGAGAVVAGAGLTKTGSTLDVVGTANRITVSADAIDISTSYVGQASITTLGTITTGVWTGTAIAATSGGTGLSTYTTGDILYASAANTLAKLAKGASGTFMMMGASIPEWTATLDGGTF